MESSSGTALKACFYGSKHRLQPWGSEGHDTLKRGFAGVEAELVAEEPGSGLAGRHVNDGHSIRASAASVHLDVGGAIIGHMGSRRYV
jgi:hypothetical protein